MKKDISILMMNYHILKPTSLFPTLTCGVFVFSSVSAFLLRRLPPPVPSRPPHSHSLTLTHSLTHITHSLTHTHSHSLTHTHSLITHSTHSLTLTHWHSLTHSLSLTHSHTLTHTRQEWIIWVIRQELNPETCRLDRKQRNQRCIFK